MIVGIGEAVAGFANGRRSQLENQAADKRQANLISGLQGTNPGRYDLAALFGSQKALNKIAKRGGNDIFAGLRGDIQRYMQPTSFGPGGPPILSSLIGDPQQYLSNFNNSLGFLDQAVNTAAEANRTGLPTDGTALFNEAIRRYMNEALPAAAETSGLGVTSSGFQATGQRAANDLLGQASLANIDLAEAAANRRMQAAPLLQGLTAARQALPINLANDLTSLFNFEQRKPIDLFTSLFTLGSNQGPFQAPSYSPFNSGTSGTAAILQGLGGFLGSPAGGQVLSGIGTGLNNLYNNWFGGPGVDQQYGELANFGGSGIFGSSGGQ